jgi:hypothetical protein
VFINRCVSGEIYWWQTTLELYICVCQWHILVSGDPDRNSHRLTVRYSDGKTNKRSPKCQCKIVHRLIPFPYANLTNCQSNTVSTPDPHIESEPFQNLPFCIKVGPLPIQFLNISGPRYVVETVNKHSIFHGFKNHTRIGHLNVGKYCCVRY